MDWTPFAVTAPPPVATKLLVWDCRTDQPTLVNHSSNGMMEEERSGKKYTVEFNMFYSHWALLDLGPREREINDWRIRKGIVKS